MMSYELADFALIKTVTALHPGVGRGGEVVDLPVQRDGLGFPMIYGSSLKGAMKSTIGGALASFLFGPEVEEVEKFSSPVAVLDAYLLAFPVRSLIGVYGYATAPLLLKRCRGYAELVGSLSKAGPAGSKFQSLKRAVEALSGVSVGRGEVYVVRSDLFLVPQLSKVVVNEELWLNPKSDSGVGSSLTELARVLGLEEERLMLLSDEEVGRAVEKSLVRVTRVRLSRETKTVEEGGLWTEEYIPRETLLYTVLLYSKPRVPRSSKELMNGMKQVFGKEEPCAGEVREKLLKKLRERENYLVIGGHETIGRGIVKLELL